MKGMEELVPVFGACSNWYARTRVPTKYSSSSSGTTLSSSFGFGASKVTKAYGDLEVSEDVGDLGDDGGILPRLSHSRVSRTFVQLRRTRVSSAEVSLVRLEWGLGEFEN